MPNTTSLRAKINSHCAFFQEFIKHPFQIGSVIPSSRFLERRVLAAARIAVADTIVELGPGTGGTTRAILAAMCPHAKLLSVELNPHLHAMVSKIQDDRLVAHLGSAGDLEEILASYGLGAPNVVISGIPFSTMSHSMGSHILARVSDLLAPNGRFVAYQFSDRVATLCEPYMGAGSATLEPLNIPPMRVYEWEKKAG